MTKYSIGARPQPYLTTSYYLILDSAFFFFFLNLHSLHCTRYHMKGWEINQSLGVKTPFKVHKKTEACEIKSEGLRVSMRDKNVIRVPFLFFFHCFSHCLGWAVTCFVHRCDKFPSRATAGDSEPAESFQSHAGRQKQSCFWSEINPPETAGNVGSMTAAAGESKQVV